MPDGFEHCPLNQRTIGCVAQKPIKSSKRKLLILNGRREAVWIDKNHGLGDGIGWHTVRHSYRSWLDETGAPMKVQQELMRHSSIQTTMNIYGAAMSETKRRANTAVVRMVLSLNTPAAQNAFGLRE